MSADLLDVLAEIEAGPWLSPTVDLQRGYRPLYETCPDCNGQAYRAPYNNPAHKVYKVLGVGWLILNACRCGRYVWRSLGFRGAYDIGHGTPWGKPQGLEL